MKYVHTNIVARDWKKLSDFYIKVFDCKIKPPVRNLSGTWLGEAIGLSEASLQGVHLELPGYKNGPTLEIYSYQDWQDTSLLNANYRGFCHIAFEVNDVEKTFKLALKNGGSALGKITKKPIEGVGFLTIVYFRDPEGNIVELQSWG